MKFKYTGQENPPGSGSTIVFGNTRVKIGEVFEVPQQFEFIARKNRFFEQVGPVENAVEGTKDAIYGDDRDTSQNVDRDQTDDEDRSGVYKDTVELSKADLIAEAEALGVEIDRRWSGKTIGDKIDAFIKAKREAEGQI
jgi:hypothetical protein